MPKIPYFCVELWCSQMLSDAASGMRIKQMGATLSGSTWGEGKVWLGQFGGLSAWSSARVCIASAYSPWTFPTVHGTDVVLPQIISHMVPQVWGCLWQVFFPFHIVFFLPVSHWREDSVNAEQWHSPAGPEGWGIICGCIQIQALQNSLHSSLVIPEMGRSVFRKGVSYFESAVFCMECTISIFCTQVERGSGIVRTKSKVLL